MAVLESGHRTLPHTAEVVIEAWAPTRDRCFTGAVHALVETFADTSAATTTRPLSLRLPPAEDDELLAVLLEEVLHLVEVMGVVPAQVSVHALEDGGLAGFLDVAPLPDMPRLGPVPRGVARSGVTIALRDGLWTCQAVVDG
jgi:SHS2 domain-containing protein